MTERIDPRRAPLGVLRRGLALLRSVSAVLADPHRWSDDLDARDREGFPILGLDLAEIALAPETYARSLLAELYAQARARGWQIEFERYRGAPIGFRQAPQSFLLAAEALASGALRLIRRDNLYWSGHAELRAVLRAMPPPTRVVWLLDEINRTGGHTRVLEALRLAEQTLQTELDRRTNRGAA